MIFIYQFFIIFYKLSLTYIIHKYMAITSASQKASGLNFTGGQPNSFSSPSTRASEVARKVNPQSRKRCSWRMGIRKRSNPMGKSMGNIWKSRKHVGLLGKICETYNIYENIETNVGNYLSYPFFRGYTGTTSRRYGGILEDPMKQRKQWCGCGKIMWIRIYHHDPPLFFVIASYSTFHSCIQLL